MTNNSAVRIELSELENITGGITAPYDYTKHPNYCHYSGRGHNFKATGGSRPTDAWFYDTEEHYVCACGKGYLSAGFWDFGKKWD
ncbi:hypothetical protein [Ruminococcus sp.]|uniref:hypothetical protein n=1 Tax=Ruminococcus sp. TaxID=41978 RepID=UPI0025EC6A60|nr:hypothetical protein [Ruminococcus sp.]MBQ8967485.1 hypothetical protein [Ruminococcus sp.]